MPTHEPAANWRRSFPPRSGLSTRSLRLGAGVLSWMVALLFVLKTGGAEPDAAPFTVPPLPEPRGEVIHVATVEELLAAVDRVKPAGTILIANGHYRLPRVIVLEGKRDIALRGASADAAKVIFTGRGWDSGAQGDDLIHIGHCDGVTIADLTFADCRSYGIKVEAENAPRNIHIYRCCFRDIGVRAIKGSAGDDPETRAVKGSVRGCTFENTRVPPADWLFGGDYIAAIDMMALEDWTFSDNVFRNIKGRNGGARAAIFIWVRSRQVVVERNRIVACDRGIAFGNPGQSTANLPGERLVYVADGVIRNNFIAGGPDCGIELWHADRIKVLHNTIWRPERNWARGIRVGTGTAHTELVNNLIHGEIRLEGGEAEVRRNLAGRLDGYFMDPASGNLALTPTALGAVNQAEPRSDVTDDIRGRARPARPDLGAWELDGRPEPGRAVAVAVPAVGFLNSLGVCSAVSRRGENLPNTVNAIRHLGIRWIRTGYESGIPVDDLIALHGQTGVRFSYGLMSGGTNIARLLDGARQLASVGALLALEGNNEPNNWGVTYEGQRGGRTNSWLPVAKLQRDLCREVKSDPVLKDYPVWSLSENGAQEDNVGLQFLTIPAGAGTLMPDDTRFADYANCHNYLTHPGWPGLHDNQTWVAADPTSACRVDGLYGNYGLTWRRRFPGYSDTALLTLPRVTTETGVTLEGPLTEELQARLYLSVYLDQFKRGWKHTAIYLLRDRTDEGGNQTFGFYRPDYTSRPAATYLRNLTTILADEASTSASGKLDYSIPDQPATVHDMLLQKSDGRFALVVWDERFTGGSDNVTVKLGAAAASVKVYDPTIGTSPIQSLSQVKSVGLTLSNHPVVIEFTVPIRSLGAAPGETNGAGPADVFVLPMLIATHAPAAVGPRRVAEQPELKQALENVPVRQTANPVLLQAELAKWDDAPNHRSQTGPGGTEWDAPYRTFIQTDEAALSKGLPTHAEAARQILADAAKSLENRNRHQGWVLYIKHFSQSYRPDSATADLKRLYEGLVGLGTGATSATNALPFDGDRRLTIYRDVVYGRTHPEIQTLDAYLVKSAQPAPVLIEIHGGGWRRGSKSQFTYRGNLVDAILEAGISVISIDYRLTPRHLLPAQMEDVARAVQFLRSKALTWNLDPTRIAALGGSAGAHLGAWVALHDDLAKPASADPIERISSRLTCFVAISGPMDLTRVRPTELKRQPLRGQDFANAFTAAFGCTAEEFEQDPDVRRRIREASPLFLVTSDDPAAFVMAAWSEELTGLRDPPVPAVINDPHSAWQSVLLAEAMRKAGPKITCRVGPEVGRNPDADTAAILRFLGANFNAP